MENRKKIMLVFGTRPEAIKMAPVLRELKNHERDFETQVVVTGQHRQMLDQTLRVFGIMPDHDLNLMTENQSLDELFAKAHINVGKIFEAQNPDLILVQGDTTTVAATALSAYHHRIKLGHVEAGLRSFEKYNPFPEEINRVIADSMADLCFAPTDMARTNLLRMGIPQDKIFVTGNTVVDALLQITAEEYAFENERLLHIDFANDKVILLTTHRRENYITGEMDNIMESVNTLVERHPEIHIIFPLHLNPNVRGVVIRKLQKHDRIHIMDPLSYKDLAKVMRQCYLILTDSGGIQEEGPAFGKPVLVLRNVTERPEGIASGVAKLVGTNTHTIIAEVERLLNRAAYEKMARVANPYGDGTAARKIVQIIKNNL